MTESRKSRKFNYSTKNNENYEIHRIPLQNNEKNEI